MGPDTGELDCMFVYLSAGPRHRAYLNDCNKYLRCGLIQIVNEDKKYPWTSEVPLHCVQETITDGISQSRSDLEVVRRRFQDVLLRYRPKVVFHTRYDLNFMRAIARDTRSAGAISILMSDSTSADHPRNALREWLKGRILRPAFDGALCSGIRSRLYLQSLGFRDERIWNGVDAIDNSHFSTIADRARSDESSRKRLGLPDRYILCAARHSPEKDLYTLLEAFRSVIKVHGDYSLVLCGSGPMTDELHSYTKKYGIGEKVLFRGWVPYDEMPFYYALASVSVLCSNSEPWGLVINESLAAGTPSIVSDICGCVPELVRRGVSGLTFRSGDASDLARVLSLGLEGVFGSDAVNQCRSIVAPWSIRNQTLGILDCLRAFNVESERLQGGETL